MDFGDLEKLLGIPPGSTVDNSTGQVKPNMDNLVSGIDNKTKELSQQFENSSKQIKDASSDSYSIEKLDADRKKIIEEAEMIYQISLRILKKLERDIEDKISPDAKLYASAGPLVNSVASNLKIISDLKTKYRQEEEMKLLTSASLSDAENGSLDMSWDGIQKIIDASRIRQGKLPEPPVNAKDAVLVDGEPVDLEKEEETEENNEVEKPEAESKPNE